MSIKAIEAVIEYFGTQDAMAAALKIKSPSISEWKRRGSVPAERCLAIENATKGQVTRYELRPDVFGKKAA